MQMALGSFQYQHCTRVVRTWPQPHCGFPLVIADRCEGLQLVWDWVLFFSPLLVLFLWCPLSLFRSLAARPMLSFSL